MSQCMSRRERLAAFVDAIELAADAEDRMTDHSPWWEMHEQIQALSTAAAHAAVLLDEISRTREGTPLVGTDPRLKGIADAIREGERDAYV